ncbi:MAG: cell wall hydrolase, partial [SAR324 cluster bacterium]|nr:cell wall hydrolase [SAR324 cluster bacterium]
YQGPRIKHKTWACQFSWFCDGKSDLMRVKRLRDVSRRIATLALLFPEKDITLGATHYHANYVNPIWAQKLTLTTQFGRHIFYR